MTWVLLILLIAAVAALAVLAVLFRQNRRPETPGPDPALVLLQQQLQGFQDRLDRFGDTVSQRLQQGNQALNERLDNAARVIGDVQNRLGRLAQTNEQILTVSKDIASLGDLMRAPKFRGGMGELFLEDLLKQCLPPEHFALQHRMKTGVVDAVIRLGDHLVPVDSKFPMPSFTRLCAAETDEERASASKQFYKDVRDRVNECRKYICPDEGTFDFALMYIPAENIYYETIIKSGCEGERSCFEYCLENKIIPVSPNSFYLYLQTILLGLQGMKVEQWAAEILADLKRLQGDFGKFQMLFDQLGAHLENASKKYVEASKVAGKVDSKLQQLETHDRALEMAGE